MRRDETPLDPDGGDTCFALAVAMVWTLLLIALAIGLAAIGWAPAQ